MGPATWTLVDISAERVSRGYARRPADGRGCRQVGAWSQHGCGVGEAVPRTVEESGGSFAHTALQW